jgi:hypothetical protein
MFLDRKGLRIFVYREAIDMRCGFGAPGKAWRLQWAKFPLWKGSSQSTRNQVLGLWR